MKVEWRGEFAPGQHRMLSTSLSQPESAGPSRT